MTQVTYWVDIHPGGAYNIQKWSENNGTFLVYPSLHERVPHGMANWNNNWQKFTYVGRFGDLLEIGDLPNSLKRVEVSNFFGNQLDSDDAKVMVCGSPGEVSNDKTDGLVYDAHTGYMTVFLDRGYNKNYNRQYVWFITALEASDQLRQRVAWAFSQVRFCFGFGCGFGHLSKLHDDRFERHLQIFFLCSFLGMD